MSFLLLPICYFLRNGVTVDDLVLVLAGGAMVILMIGGNCRALVNTPVFYLLPIGRLTECSSVFLLLAWSYPPLTCYLMCSSAVLVLSTAASAVSLSLL